MLGKPEEEHKKMLLIKRVEKKNFLEKYLRLILHFLKKKELVKYFLQQEMVTTLPLLGMKAAALVASAHGVRELRR